MNAVYLKQGKPPHQDTARINQRNTYKKYDSFSPSIAHGSSISYSRWKVNHDSVTLANQVGTAGTVFVCTHLFFSRETNAPLSKKFAELGKMNSGQHGGGVAVEITAATGNGCFAGSLYDGSRTTLFVQYIVVALTCSETADTTIRVQVFSVKAYNLH